MFPRCHGYKNNAGDSQYPLRVGHEIVAITLSAVQFTLVMTFRLIHLLEAYILEASTYPAHRCISSQLNVVAHLRDAFHIAGPRGIIHVELRQSTRC